MKATRVRPLFGPLLILALVAITPRVLAGDAILDRIFQKAGIEGTLLIESVNTGERWVHDPERAERLYPVASTFKILNSLIALEEGVVTSAESRLAWDGQHHDFPAWNRDQTLDSAFRVSCVWCYQALAEQIGGQKYVHYLGQTGYGQLKEPFNPTTFWLDGTLVISAQGQVDFLRQVVERRLPFRVTSYDVLRQIMHSPDTTPGLHAKTGWAMTAKPAVGWYVGYLNTTDDVWLFALNMDIRQPSDLPLRQALVLDALADKGLLHPKHPEQS